jgi:hypothetical protein
MTDPTSPKDRAEPRRRVLLAGRIVYGPAEMTVDCAIVDLSQAGARVRLAGAQLLGEPIYLVNLSHGYAYKARQAWRRGDLLGLAFTEHYDLRAPPPQLPPLIRRLWVEQTR